MTDGIKSIYWVCHSPSPYNDQLFRSLSEALPVPISFCFMEQASRSHPWKYESGSGFRSRAYHRRFGIDWRLVASVCGERNSLFVTGAWQDPTSQIIIILLLITNRPYAVWNDTPSVSRKRNLLKRLLRRIFLKVIFHRAAAVMGTGHVALSVLAKMGCPPDKLLNFPCFVDLEEFLPIERHRANQTITIGSCGRLHNDKGFDLALQALAGIFREHPFPFCYRLAGTGPELENLKVLARNLGIADRVEFMGWLNPTDLPIFYRSLDLFLHPARTEPYGVSVLEAMATGTVVIASDETAAALDRINPGVNGFLHAATDINSLSKILVQVLSLSNADIARVRVAARKTAEDWPTARGVRIVSQLVRTLSGFNEPAATEKPSAKHRADARLAR